MLSSSKPCLLSTTRQKHTKRLTREGQHFRTPALLQEDPGQFQGPQVLQQFSPDCLVKLDRQKCGESHGVPGRWLPKKGGATARRLLKNENIDVNCPRCRPTSPSALADIKRPKFLEAYRASLNEQFTFPCFGAHHLRAPDPGNDWVDGHLDLMARMLDKLWRDKKMRTFIL